MPVIGPDKTPIIAGYATSGGIAVRGTGTAAEQADWKIKTGDHKIERIRRIAAEWVPEDRGALKFRDSVLQELERLANNTPDYDTGYFLAEAGNKKYTFDHQLGSIPKRSVVYLSYVEEPVAGKDTIFEVVPVLAYDGATQWGFFLQHSASGNQTYIYTSTDYVYSQFATFVSCYLRVLLWR